MGFIKELEMPKWNILHCLQECDVVGNVSRRELVDLSVFYVSLECPPPRVKQAADIGKAH